MRAEPGMKTKADSLGARIAEILGLDRVVAMDFSFRCDQSPDPIVTVTFIPTKEQGDRIIETLKEYELVEREGKDAPHD